MRNDRTECLEFVRSIIPAIMPPLVRKCESAVFSELLGQADGEYLMHFDFRVLSLSLTEIIVHIAKGNLDDISFSFILRMDNTLQENCAGYSGDPFQILSYLEEEGGRNSVIQKLEDAVNAYFDMMEQRACMIQIHNKVEIGINDEHQTD